MEDYGLIATIIALLITQLFYINRTIGRLETKIRYCAKEINRLNKQLETLIKNRYTTFNNDADA
jgi:biopolymer transport protein ExbB/TolQ